MIRIALLTLLALFAASAAATDATAPLADDSVYLLDASLTDQDGNPVRLADLRGRPVLAAMFYTSCRYVCPLIIDSARGVDHALDDAERAGLQVVLITMDPARDDPAALRRVADRRRLEMPRWQLLRPEAADVRRIAAVLDVRYRALSDGEFNHTSPLVLLDHEGRRIASTIAAGPVPDADFLAAVRKALADAPTGKADGARR